MKLIFFLLFLPSVRGLPPKHVLLTTSMTWAKAQATCRNFFTDLSPIITKEDEARFLLSAAQYSAWIGLYRDDPQSRWKWSGAGLANYTNLPAQPISLLERRNVVIWTKDGWQLRYGTESYNSFCFNLIMVEEKMSWEEALAYCREKHVQLTSLLSETELMMALGEMEPAQITERVWMGLRYLRDRWMWTNGDTLDYKAWADDGNMQCPAVSGGCGALNRKGVWENWDCEEKLNFICY